MTKVEQSHNVIRIEVFPERCVSVLPAAPATTDARAAHMIAAAALARSRMIASRVMINETANVNMWLINF